LTKFSIGTKNDLTLKDLERFISGNGKLELGKDSIEKIKRGRNFLENQIKQNSNPIYGINTGFGSLSNKKIPKDQLVDLQINLVRSHACGLGDIVPERISKWVLLLKIISLSKGYSGVTPKLVNACIDCYNSGIFPVIYEMGSLGASGDLAPLAHLALSIMGEGSSWNEGRILKTKSVLNKAGLSPYQLVEKEGLAVLNGTQFMQALTADCLSKAWRLMNWACLISSLSIEAYMAKYDAFHPEIHRIRNQIGQRKIAEKILDLLKGSELAKEEKNQVQDPYSFRCIPQVLGASLDAINYVEMVFENEVNGVTDNPNVIPESELIISGGNFHGQPLAITLDFLSIAIAEIGNISERRVFQLLSGKRGLPEFLTHDPGLNSGLMIPQYTAASLVSMNKQLCTPSSVDSITSSNGQEDHVSMGANAGLKTIMIEKNLEEILGIELLTASQALSFRNKSSSPILNNVIAEYRKFVPPIKRDRFLHEDLKKSVLFIQEYKGEFGL
jgi:histidine ammonia-lyase